MKNKFNNISVNTLIPLIVVMDMLAVSLVVPLLHQYFLLSGITSARQRELLSSVYASSQILGGLVLGMLSDYGVLTRKNSLLLSFVGCIVSYGIIAKGDMLFWLLVCSRIIVGFVKQTITVSTAILTLHAKKDANMKLTVTVGRIKASTTIAWIVGPSLGAFLFKHVHMSAPPLLACVIFTFLFIFGLAYLPTEEPDDDVTVTSEKKTLKKCISNIYNNFKSTMSSFQSGNIELVCVIASQLLFTLMQLVTSYSSMTSYYEERYGIEPHIRGYLSSYRSSLGFTIQTFAIQPLLHRCGGERNAAFLAAIAMSSVSFLETKVPFNIYLFILCPLFMASTNLLEISVKSLVTQVAPASSISSVLATLDVLTNIVKVTVPFYRATLFVSMAKVCGADENCAMAGDPDPFFWNISSGLHWLFTAGLLYFLLIANNNVCMKKSHNGDSLSDKKHK